MVRNTKLLTRKELEGMDIKELIHLFHSVREMILDRTINGNTRVLLDKYLILINQMIANKKRGVIKDGNILLFGIAEESGIVLFG